MAVQAPNMVFGAHQLLYGSTSNQNGVERTKGGEVLNIDI